MKVLGEESDLPEALLPELGPCKRADFEVCFAEPVVEQPQVKCVFVGELQQLWLSVDLAGGSP